jgi:hypothetical protein
MFAIGAQDLDISGIMSPRLKLLVTLECSSLRFGEKNDAKRREMGWSMCEKVASFSLSSAEEHPVYGFVQQSWIGDFIGSVDLS